MVLFYFVVFSQHCLPFNKSYRVIRSFILYISMQNSILQKFCSLDIVTFLVQFDLYPMSYVAGIDVLLNHLHA